MKVTCDLIFKNDNNPYFEMPCVHVLDYSKEAMQDLREVYGGRADAEIKEIIIHRLAGVLNPEMIKKDVEPQECFKCGKTIKPLGKQTGEPERAMWDGGIVSKISGGYGSSYDLSSILIAICDDCADKKYKEIR